MNKDLFIKGLLFSAGAAIGSLITWKLVKTKYEQYANEEIESVREYYSQRKTEGSQGGMKKPDEYSLEEIRDIVKDLGYQNESIMKEKEENENKEEEENMSKPYVIAPEESWEQDYPTITLTYYEGDGVLADEHNKIISNVDELVGEDFADHFGEYEDDSVYIRNDELEVYYEILRDLGTYEDSI